MVVFVILLLLVLFIIINFFAFDVLYMNDKLLKCANKILPFHSFKNLYFLHKFLYFM